MFQEMFGSCLGDPLLGRLDRTFNASLIERVSQAMHAIETAETFTKPKSSYARMKTQDKDISKLMIHIIQ